MKTTKIKNEALKFISKRDLETDFISYLQEREYYLDQNQVEELKNKSRKRKLIREEINEKLKDAEKQKKIMEGWQ